jgi:hypothetical protein
MHQIYKRIQLQFRNIIRNTVGGTSASPSGGASSASSSMSFSRSSGNGRYVERPAQIGVICIVLLLLAVTVGFAYTFASFLFDIDDSSNGDTDVLWQQQQKVIADENFALHVVNVNVDPDRERESILKRLDNHLVRIPKPKPRIVLPEITTTNAIPIQAQPNVPEINNDNKLNNNDQQSLQQQQQHQQAIPIKHEVHTVQSSSTHDNARAKLTDPQLAQQPEQQPKLDEWWTWLESQSELWHQIDQKNWQRREKVQEVCRYQCADATLCCPMTQETRVAIDVPSRMERLQIHCIRTR